MSKHSHSTCKGGEGDFPSSVVLVLNFITSSQKSILQNYKTYLCM
ncbi:hypothetical protein HMPREF9430_01535 [Solobacterium moorei F0204]|uniref:Uncharacterized protein n=1 Tax=Solobacterium moorei F0204 TaxID=706433 RepID=E7MPQ3_9FIRM|nr:hypothetical protein HMPREF9430_01535 [Solobacterium moorei F0204]